MKWRAVGIRYAVARGLVAMAGSVAVATDRLSARAPVRDRPMIGSGLRASCQVTMTLLMTCTLVQML